jgi:hypothetical protein
MKIFVLAIFLSTYIPFTDYLRAQSSGFEIEVEIVNTLAAEKEVSRNAVVTVYGVAPYDVLLFNKPPAEAGTKLLELKDKMEDQFTLEGLSTGDYFLMIRDDEERVSATRFTVE